MWKWLFPQLGKRDLASLPESVVRKVAKPKFIRLQGQLLVPFLIMSKDARRSYNIVRLLSLSSLSKNIFLQSFKWDKDKFHTQKRWKALKSCWQFFLATLGGNVLQRFAINRIGCSLSIKSRIQDLSYASSLIGMTIKLPLGQHKNFFYL